jgi:plasmid stabilization system protein ParE
MEVIFAEWAENCLKEIYDYYSQEASPAQAAEIVNKIIDRAEALENYSNRGRIENDLKSLGKGHRYLLEYHYKIIYKVEGEVVIITDIFSNRQNPSSKLKRNN